MPEDPKIRPSEKAILMFIGAVSGAVAMAAIYWIPRLIIWIVR